MSEPMMKGAVMREFLDWYEATHGTDRIRRIVERLPSDLRAYLDPAEPMVKLLPASWYPARIVHIGLDVIGEGLTEPVIERMAHDATRSVLDRSTGSIYRFALRKVVTPELYALSVPRLWRQFHSTGDRALRVTSATTAESKVSRWGGHHPMLCTITIELMCAIFEKMGCKDLTWKRTACVARGAKECVTLLDWK